MLARTDHLGPSRNVNMYTHVMNIALVHISFVIHCLENAVDEELREYLKFVMKQL